MYIFHENVAAKLMKRKLDCQSINNIKRKQCGNRRHLVRWKAKTSNKLSTVTIDT